MKRGSKIKRKWQPTEIKQEMELKSKEKTKQTSL